MLPRLCFLLLLSHTNGLHIGDYSSPPLASREVLSRPRRQEEVNVVVELSAVTEINYEDVEEDSYSEEDADANVSNSDKSADESADKGDVKGDEMGDDQGDSADGDDDGEESVAEDDGCRAISNPIDWKRSSS